MRFRSARFNKKSAKNRIILYLKLYLDTWLGKVSMSAHPQEKRRKNRIMLNRCIFALKYEDVLKCRRLVQSKKMKRGSFFAHLHLKYAKKANRGENEVEEKRKKKSKETVEVEGEAGEKRKQRRRGS